MTLVETMVAMAIFAVILLGSLGLITFSMRTMDATRATAQADRMLANEMEAMRMRSWNDRTTTDANTGSSVTLFGLKSLGTGKSGDGTSTTLTGLSGCTEKPVGNSILTSLGGGKYSYAKTVYDITPYAVYGVRNTAGTGAGVMGTNVATDTTVSLRNATGFTLRRTVELTRSSDGGAVSVVADVDCAQITVSAAWTDRNGPHTRTITQYLSKNGLSDFYYRSVPQ